MSVSSDRARDDLSQAVRRLVELVQQENAALKDMDFGRAGSLLTVKFAAADALEASIRAVALDPQAHEATGEPYSHVVKDLSDLLSENETLHHRSARLQRRVQKVVARLLTIETDEDVQSAARPARIPAHC